MVNFLLKENNQLKGQVYEEVTKKKIASPSSNKRKKGSAKRRRNDESIISKQSQDPKSDIRDILSEKMNRRRLETLSKSQERSFEKYGDINIQRINGTPSPYKEVRKTVIIKNQKDYLNKFENESASKSPNKYFNKQPIKPQDVSISPQTRQNIEGNKAILNDYRRISPVANLKAVKSPEKSQKSTERVVKSTERVQKSTIQKSPEPESAQKEQSIRELREKYNQLMR